jgi:hypothetical protein
MSDCGVAGCLCPGNSAGVAQTGFFARILHESHSFICKAFRGAAVLGYGKPLITRQMSECGSPKG